MLEPQPAVTVATSGGNQTARGASPHSRRSCGVLKLRAAFASVPVGVVMLRPRQRFTRCLCDSEPLTSDSVVSLLLSSTQSRSEPNIRREHLTRPPSRAPSRALSLFSFGDSKLLGALLEAFFKQGAKTVSMPGEALVDPIQSSPEMDINKPPLHPASPTLHAALIPSYLTLHSPLRLLSPVLFTLKCQ